MPATISDRLFGETTSVAIKGPCRTVSTANITLSGLQTVNSVALAESDRVLVTGQSDSTKNGIYNVSTSGWQRAADFDGNRDVVQGTIVPVVNGSSGANLYEVTAANPIVIGSSAITFSLRYGANLRIDQTAAEIAAGVTPVNYAYGVNPYDVRRVGIVPNDSSKATANTAALKALLDPTKTGITGPVIFPNTTGADNYYFNDNIPVRDGIIIDLCGSTITFTKTGVSGDANAGFFHALRNFSISNGSIVVNYTYVSGSNTGNALAFGARGSDCALWPGVYDSLLASPMGNITVKNISISSNAGGGQARGIYMLGGLQNVRFENVVIDGQSALLNGIYSEFGWATNEANEYQRQTSHPHNVSLENVRVLNVTQAGVAGNGTYQWSINNLKVYSSAGVCSFGPGESLFYRPWSGVDGAGSKHNILMKNIVGGGITGLGIAVTGASAISGSYLNNPPTNDNPNGLSVANQTDLLSFALENFSMVGTVNNYGISTSASRASIKNGTVSGFQHGINTTDECTQFHIDNVKVLDSTGIGITIGQAVDIYSPARLSIGKIENCFIAGSGTSGASAAISVSSTQSLTIENCRFGYETAHDNKSETTQLQAVTVATSAFGVICRGNYVAAVTGGATAYNLASASSSHRNCTIENASGIVTTTGIWKSVLQGVSADRGDTSPTLTVQGDFVNQRFDTALTGNRTITLSTTNAVNGDRFHITRTGLGAFTLAVGALKTIPNSTAASVAVEFDGSAWKLRDYTLL